MTRSTRSNGDGRAPGTVAKFATEEIRTAILEGRYLPGSRLDQQMLADELGASIIPVRESLRQLEAEGLVQITPRRGAFVVQPTDAEVQDLYKLRAVLEAYAIRQAVPQLTVAEVTELRSLIKEMVTVAKTNAYEKWINLSNTWHRAIYSAARSPILLEMIAELQNRCRLTSPSHTVVRGTRYRIASTQDYAKIMKAIEEGDAELAAQMTSEHLHSVTTNLLTDDDAGKKKVAASR